MDLDDDLKTDVMLKLAGRKRKRDDEEDEETKLEQTLFKNPDGDKARERDAAQQRAEAQKKKFEKDKAGLLQRRFKGSSFLTPESVAYLNQAIKEQKTSKLDEELIYAGLHDNKLPGSIKHKRNEKNKQRFKGRRKRSQTKRKNRHRQ